MEETVFPMMDSKVKFEEDMRGFLQEEIAKLESPARRRQGDETNHLDENEDEIGKILDPLQGAPISRWLETRRRNTHTHTQSTYLFTQVTIWSLTDAGCDVNDGSCTCLFLQVLYAGETRRV